MVTVNDISQKTLYALLRLWSTVTFKLVSASRVSWHREFFSMKYTPVKKKRVTDMHLSTDFKWQIIAYPITVLWVHKHYAKHWNDNNHPKQGFNIINIFCKSSIRWPSIWSWKILHLFFLLCNVSSLLQYVMISSFNLKCTQDKNLFLSEYM